MAKVPLQLKHAAALTKQHTDQLPPGQAHWWLRADDFIRLPKRVRGDEPIDQLVHVEPGTYTLGVGPVRGGVREQIVVEASAAPPPAAKLAKGSLVIEGKTIVITGDLDAMDRDAAKAWLEERGAKVSGSLSKKTDYLLVGHEPGPKKLEKAKELGTREIREAELGMVAAPVTVTKQDETSLLAAFIAKSELAKQSMTKIEKIVGPSHFDDLGMLGHELWGISIGPRGGRYTVWIDLKDRPRFAMQCNCREYRPCTHAYALLVTAQKHFVPPAPPPDGHEAAARYRPTME